MTEVPCFLCGVDSIATCVACQQRVCNRHLVISVGSLNHYASLTQVDWSGTPVALVHPQGETSTSVPGGAYLAAFVGGSPRCLACRGHDGQEALNASKDPLVDAGKGERYVDLATARASAAFRTQDEAGRQQATELAAVQALRQMDERTSEATAAFLPMAAGIELQRIVTDKKFIPEKRRFGMQVSEARWDTAFVEAHVIYHAMNDNSEDGPRFDWTLFVLPDGRIHFMEIKDYGDPAFRDRNLAWAGSRRPDGYEVDFEKKGGRLYSEGNYVWSRRNPSPGLLPCYRDRDGLTLTTPGNEYADYHDVDRLVRVCHETAVWFVGALASYLESHTANP
jgi:hypothetical protein